MPIVDELSAILSYQVEGQGALKEFNEGLDQTESKAKKKAATLKKLGAGLAAGATIAAGVTTKAVTQFAGVEREMNRIGITAGANVEQTVKATASVQKLASEMALPISSVVGGLDTLVASGLSLEEALGFLPSVAATAQASGSSLDDIANTAVKTSSALGLQASEMQRAFDIMVQGGKAGQFELKDMAAYIPGLANSFATLGYEGEEGLKQLIATLQTIREDTGSSAQAATQAQNIFGKMYSEAQANNFADFGIDLRKGMEEGIAAGEKALDVFVRLSEEALQGDMTKLPLLFTDQEFRLGMQSLITSSESFKGFLDEVNSADVDGTVFRDLNRLLGDTQAQIDKTSTQWERLINNLGQAVAPAANEAMGKLNEKLERQEAIAKANEERGMSTKDRILFGLSSKESKDRRAREGGYVRPEDEARAAENPELYRATAYEGELVLPTEPPKIPVEIVPKEGWIERLSGGTPEGGFKVPTQPALPPSFTPPAEATAPYAKFQDQLNQMNSHLASMTGGAMAEATITDARQDNRQFPMPVNVTVNQNVTQAVDAPAQAARATGNAAAGAAAQKARIASEPSF